MFNKNRRYLSLYFAVINLTLCILFLGISQTKAVVNGDLYEVISDAINDAGDVWTAGGLDYSADSAFDVGRLTASGNSANGYPPSVLTSVWVYNHYANNPYVEVQIGFRSNNMQTTKGKIYWDGRLLATCNPYGTTEGLKVIKVVANTAEYNFRAGRHTVTIEAKNTSNAYDFFEIDAILLKRLGGINATPTQNWMLVYGDTTTTTESTNFQLLRTKLQNILGVPPAVKAASAVTPSDKSNYDLILVGSTISNTLVDQLMTDRNLKATFSGESAFIQAQGYVVGVYPEIYARGRKVILAGGLQEMGAVYAISHLRVHLLAEGTLLYLDSEGSPYYDRDFIEEVYKPKLEERAEYMMLAAGFTTYPITANTWTQTQWQDHIDKLITARMTHLYFYLWGDLGLYYPKSPQSYNSTNLFIHQRLQEMIDYAHTRGLKVVFMFTPTLIPGDIFAANSTNIAADILYVRNGYPVVCQGVQQSFSFNGNTWSNVSALMVDAYTNEIDWFKKADGFMICYYDVGGCFCTVSSHPVAHPLYCRDNQAYRLVEQVAWLTPVIKAKNPNAKILVNTWAIWDFEQMYGAYRLDYFARLSTYFSTNTEYRSVTDVDNVIFTYTSIIEAKQKGFRTNGFVYDTNIETGYVFLTPMLAWLPSAIATGNSLKVNGDFNMRIEGLTKFGNTFFAAEWYWDPTLPADKIVEDYSMWITERNAVAGQKIKWALLYLDHFTNDGSAKVHHTVIGDYIADLVESTMPLLPSSKQNELEWLLTTTRCMRILGEGVDKQSDPTRTAQLKQEFQNVTAASPTFVNFSGYAQSKFDQYVDWLTQGWQNNHF